MRKFVIYFADRETLPGSIEKIASELGITPEQLIKRFIIKGMETAKPKQGSAIPGKTLDEFLVKNEVLKPTPIGDTEYRPLDGKSDDI